MDYIPSGDTELVPWAKNLATEAPGANEILKLPPEQVGLAVAAANTVTEKNDAATLAVAAATKAVSEKREAIKAFKKAARAFTKQAKASPGYTDEGGKLLRIYVAPVSTNLADYKAVISTKESGGYVHIHFAKNGVDGLNIYDVEPVTSALTLLGAGIPTPFIDKRASKQLGVAQLNQYKAMAVDKNTETGQWSDIISISYKD